MRYLFFVLCAGCMITSHCVQPKFKSLATACRQILGRYSHILNENNLRNLDKTIQGILFYMFLLHNSLFMYILYAHHIWTYRVIYTIVICLMGKGFSLIIFYIGTYIKCVKIIYICNYVFCMESV